MAVSGLLGLLGAAAILTGQPIDIEVASSEVLAPDALVEGGTGLTIAPDASIDLRIEHPSGVQLGLATIAALPGYLLTTSMLVLLWRLVREARHADPFIGATARRLRALGWLLIIGGPAAALTEFTAQFALSNTGTSTGARAALDLGAPALWLLGGVGLLAVGEVVRRGQVLRAELDTVV